MIHICTCNSEFQDKLYGRGMRVMNQCKKPTDVKCTVCGKIHTVSVAKKVDNSKIMGVKK